MQDTGRGYTNVEPVSLSFNGRHGFTGESMEELNKKTVRNISEKLIKLAK